jgi:hypothetical protein
MQSSAAAAAASDDEVAKRHRGVPRSGPGGCFVDHCDARIDGATDEDGEKNNDNHNNNNNNATNNDANDAAAAAATNAASDHPVVPSRSLPLRGLTFAAKDNLDVAGYRVGCGNPTWLATHPDSAQSHAVSVAALLAAGARLVGREGTGGGGARGGGAEGGLTKLFYLLLSNEEPHKRLS